MIRLTGVAPGFRYEGTKDASLIRHAASFPGSRYKECKAFSVQQNGQKCSMKSPLVHVGVVGTRAVFKGQGAIPDAGCNS